MGEREKMRGEICRKEAQEAQKGERGVSDFLSPEGTADLAQGVSPGNTPHKTDQSPEGAADTLVAVVTHGTRHQCIPNVGWRAWRITSPCNP